MKVGEYPICDWIEKNLYNQAKFWPYYVGGVLKR